MKLFPVVLRILAITSMFSPVAWGNGGGYTRGGVSETGTIKGFTPEGTQNVRILDEQLDIALGPDGAGVDVRYILKNTSDRKVGVRFGFPVEELAELDELNEDGSESEAPKKKRSAAKLEYCRDYQVELGGKSVAARFQPESKSSGKEDERFRGVRGWLVSEISFGAGEEKTMTIHYRADYPYTQISVSDDVRRSASVFKYRLSTGAVWEGPIERGRVAIRANGIHASDLKIVAPANRFRRSGAQWEWNFEKLEPTLADDLVVEAVPEENAYYGRLENGKFHGESDVDVGLIERKGVWTVLHHNYAVTASSTLPPQGKNRYDAANLAQPEGDNRTWSEGAPGPGIGEWLEFVPEVSRPLRSVRIRPGYAASKAQFEANARPKRVELVLNDEYRFEAEIADRPDEQEIAVQAYDKAVKKVRLTIRDVYRGKRDEDLCISGVRLESRTNKVPKVQPAR